MRFLINVLGGLYGVSQASISAEHTEKFTGLQKENRAEFGDDVNDMSQERERDGVKED